MTTETPSTPANPCATAPPVSPDVATITTARFPIELEKCPRQRLMNRAPTSLNASVGPRKAQVRKCRVLSRRAEGKSIAILANRLKIGVRDFSANIGRIRLNAVSASPPSRHGRTASSARLGISFGKYSPPSSGWPWSRASRKPTTAERPFVLKYLIQKSERDRHRSNDITNIGNKEV